MTKANHDVFTTEEQLTNRLTQGTGEIDTFWQQGDFSFFTGVNNIRINYATFMHDETTTSTAVMSQYYSSDVTAVIPHYYRIDA
nr:hypothetical protein [Colwellia sp.]